MVRILIFFAAAALHLAMPPAGHAQSVGDLDFQNVRACPAVSDKEAIPDFASSACETVHLYQVDPQDGLVWVRLTTELSKVDVEQTEPVALFVHGKASFAAWVNGTAIGRNGVPAMTATEEVAGVMDTQFFVPRDILVEGSNTIVLQMSALQGRVKLTSPINGIFLAQYNSGAGLVFAMMPALITFGIFLAACAFFTFIAVKGFNRLASSCLAVASAAGAGQLMFEVARGLTTYPYPLHEVRLLIILICAAILGLSLLSYVLVSLRPVGGRISAAILAGAIAVCLWTAWTVPGFDDKTLSVLFTSTVVAGLVSGWAVWQRRNGAALILAVSVAFAGLMWFGRSQFLDTYVYLAVSAILLALLFVHLRFVARERVLRKQEQQRAGELAVALKKVEAAERPQPIEITSGKRSVFLQPTDILRLAGAGDYVEVFSGQVNGGLFSGTLSELEAILPPGFIRVHRSHIVNSDHILSLERTAGGTGTLLLNDGSEVPVSRRIMPSVRLALSGD